MDDRDRANDLRARAARLREQAGKFVRRARGLPAGLPADMLIGEADILRGAADALDLQALALATPLGSA
jgi:hypothetical protein